MVTEISKAVCTRTWMNRKEHTGFHSGNTASTEARRGWPALRAGWIERRARTRTPPHFRAVVFVLSSRSIRRPKAGPNRGALCVLCGLCVKTPCPPSGLRARTTATEGRGYRQTKRALDQIPRSPVCRIPVPSITRSEERRSGLGPQPSAPDRSRRRCRSLRRSQTTAARHRASRASTTT